VDDDLLLMLSVEALANCLVNTDFFIPRGVVIRKDANTIIIENPGYIRTGKDQMLKGGISDPRNKALMKMFNMIGIGERAGSGVPDIFAVWDSQGWKAPEVEEQFNPDRTILTLSFIGRSAEKSAEKISSKSAQHTEEILSHMETGLEYSADEIAKLIGLKSSRTRQLLKHLVEQKKNHSYCGNKKQAIYKAVRLDLNKRNWSKTQKTAPLRMP
jgi:predicted HTH transcriptional regulator